MSNIKIFNGDGYWMTNIIANADRSWMISKYGSCEFTMPVISDKCRERYLNFGNFIMIEHESLPPWAGMIDTPRVWGNNKVKIKAYTPEYILNYRCVGYLNDKVTPGTMFSKLIDIANRIDDTRLFSIAPIDETGKAIKFELRYEKMYDFMRDKIAGAGYEWNINPVFENNRLRFEASLYEKFVNKVNFILAEGINIEANDDTLTEDGYIYNKYFGIGEGSSWSERVIYPTQNDTSIAKYKYREGSVEVGESGQSAVEEYTEKQLAVDKQPKLKFDVSAIDENNTFKWLRLGNVLPIILSVCGFNGDKVGTTANARITGMAYDESKGTCRLVLEEYTDDSE